MRKRRSAYIHNVNIQVQDVPVIGKNIGIQLILFLDTLGFSGDNINKRNNPAAIRKLSSGRRRKTGATH